MKVTTQYQRIVSVSTCLIVFIFCAIGVMGSAQELVLPLYDQNVPNSKTAPTSFVEKGDRKRVSNVTIPTITVFTPEVGKATGAAVIICPGGGYQFLSIESEGYNVAQAFNRIGVTAFVLKSRLPNDTIMLDKTIGPLQDAQRAIQLVRERAMEWNIDTSKVGIIGFSAGGHLASTAGTHFNRSVIENPANINLRPSFLMLIYPVISFGEYRHNGSATRLIGNDMPAALVTLYSNDQQVTKQTPPTFIVHSQDDRTVPVNNALLFYNALLMHKVPAEMHLYIAGGHGYGLNNKTTKDYWFDRAANFLRQLKFIPAN
jgi:acetyl esterase/lipase